MASGPGHPRSVLRVRGQLSWLHSATPAHRTARPTASAAATCAHRETGPTWGVPMRNVRLHMSGTTSTSAGLVPSGWQARR